MRHSVGERISILRYRALEARIKTEGHTAKKSVALCKIPGGCSDIAGAPLLAVSLKGSRRVDQRVCNNSIDQCFKRHDICLTQTVWPC